MATAADFVNVAYRENGYAESGSNRTKFGQWFGMDGEAWCAIFVSWCFAQVGMGSVMPKTASAGEFPYQAQRNNKGVYHAQGSGYSPKRGDLFIKNYSGGGYADHVGIVYSDASGNSFTTIEGNCGNKVASITRYVSEYCYVTPPFDGVSGGYGVKRYTDFPKYNLSEDMIKFIAGVIVGECSGTVLGCRQEASQMVNLNESRGRSHDDAGMRQTVKSFSQGGWYADKSFRASATQTAIDAVRFVMIEGKRVLPRYVVEHDWFPNDIINAKARGDYKVGDTVRNNSQSTYKFYCFFDGADGDIAGYFPELYEKYKDDIPWSEGADNESFMYSENAYENTEPVVVWNNRVKENIHQKLQSAVTMPPTDEPAIYANGTDITKIVGNLSWKNSIYELSTTMSFEAAKSDAAYLKDLIYTPQVGDILQYVTNGEIFRGVIIKVDDGDKDSNKYSAVDLGWYLNKTSQTYQFKNITAADAIRELCDDLSINIVMLPELTANINQIYFDKTISAILTDILDQCEGDYNFDFVPDGLRIYMIGELYAYPEFRLASNIRQEYAPDFRGNVSHSTSIEELKNSIKVTSEKDNVYTELVVEQNRDLIDKYGFLQKIVKIDPEKENAETVAKQELENNSREAETYSFEIIEKYDSYTRAGETMTVDGVRYVIESTNHRISDGWHFNKLELRKII